MLTTILLIIAGLIAVFLIAAARQPDHFTYSRSIVIAAPASAAFPYFNNMRKWQEMSPYVRLDPSAKYTFSGPESGVGAKIAWDGNGQVGAGSMIIEESKPNDTVRLRLAFLRPFACNNTVLFTLQESGGQTTVTWAMSGQSKFITKAMGVLINMDKMCGKQFEEGLANLKRLTESSTKAKPVTA